MVAETDPRPVEWSSRTEEAAWISARLAPFGTRSAASVIPKGFDGYVRLLHPARRGDPGERSIVRWREIAAWSGAAIHRGVQFQQIAIPLEAVPEPPPWSSAPTRGTLEGEDCIALIEILTAHTSSSDLCWFCLWDGYGWQGRGALKVSSEAATTVLPDPVPPEVRSGGRVELPNRSYLLYTGPSAQALAFLGSQDQTPNLWWPADRNWCVATELDLDWTYVGGSDELVSRLLSDRRLETLPVELDDSCQFELSPTQQALVAGASRTLLVEGRVTIPTPLGLIEAILTGRGPKSTVRISWGRMPGHWSGASTSRVDGSSLEQLERELAISLDALARG